MVMLPPRRILFSWAATEYCVPPKVLRSSSLCVMVIFVPLTALGQWAFYPKQHVLRVQRPELLSGSRLDRAQLGQPGATESYSHPFCAWSEPAAVGCCKHLAPALPRTLLTPRGSSIQRKPSPSHLPSPFQKGFKSTAGTRLHPEPPLLSRLKPWAPQVPLPSVANAEIRNSPPLQISGEERSQSDTGRETETTLVCSFPQQGRRWQQKQNSSAFTQLDPKTVPINTQWEGTKTMEPNSQ